MIKRPLTASVLLLAASMLSPGQLLAQAPAVRAPDADVGDGSDQAAPAQRARAKFIAGQEAIEGGRWADAIRHFEVAYDLSHAPTALFNVGFALRALGRHREARETFSRLLSEHADADPELRQEARQLREEAAGRVATMVLGRLSPALRYELRLDGNLVADDGSRPVEIELDPGLHAVRVEHPEHRPYGWEGELDDGDRLELRAELEPLPETTLWESPWFWVAVGTVVVAGGVATGYAVYQGNQPTTQTDRIVELLR